MKKAFDRDAWLTQKQEKLTEAKAALEEGLKALQTSEDWKRMLRSMAVLGRLSVLRYSFTNQLLVQSSRPGTERAATFQSWKENNRSVKKGEKGMPILAPVFRKDDEKEAALEGEGAQKLVGFRVLTVFAEDQTEGDALPSPKVPDLTAPEAFEGSVEKLKAVALTIPGQPVTGIELRSRTGTDHPTARGWYAPTTRKIVVVNDCQSRAEQFATLCHEVAHALLHPLGDAHGAPEREVEAESTAFVVCHALGLDTGASSFPYVATWARGENALNLVATSGQRIARAAAQVLDALCEAPATSGDLAA